MTPLFSTADLKKAPTQSWIGTDPMTPRAQAAPLMPALYLLSKGRKELRRHVGELQPNQVVHYATGGRWSAHELLQFVLERTGPARVSISTWTVTENPVRALVALRQAGLITELQLLFDHRIKTRCPRAFQLVAALEAKVSLAKCHAKVTVVENDNWGVAILSSQNYTRNPRIEAGAIFTDRASAAFHRDWMKRQIDNEQPFV
jgi:hypothetical protein